MNDITTTVDTHLEAYGETDPARRADLIAQVWAARRRAHRPAARRQGP